MRFIRYILRGTGFLLLGIIAIVLFVLVGIYLPPVQDYALGKALDMVNKSDSLHVEVGYMRLYPPFQLKVEDVVVEQMGDTTIVVGGLSTGIEFHKLLRGQLGLKDTWVGDAVIKIGHPDSSMYLTGQIDTLKLNGVSLNVISHRVEVDMLSILGSDISLILGDNRKNEPSDTAASSLPAWTLDISNIELDSLSYNMSIAGSIDTLAARLTTLSVHESKIKLAEQSIEIKTAAADGIKALFRSVENKEVDDEKTDGADGNESRPWAIAVDALDLRADSATYINGVSYPEPGLDTNWIVLNNIEISIDSLYNCGSELNLDIDRITAHERCGLDMMLQATLSMNADSLAVRDISLTTKHSRLAASIVMGMKSAGIPSPLLLDARGEISPEDIMLAYPSWSPVLAGLPIDEPIVIEADVTGQNDYLSIASCKISMARVFGIEASGDVYNPLDINSADGKIDIKGDMMSDILERPTATAAKLGLPLRIPRMNVKGDVTARGGKITGNIGARTGDGRMALAASWLNRSEGYNAFLTFDKFPVQAFVPDYSVADLTGSLAVKGRGIDINNLRAHSDVEMRVDNITYRDKQYQGLSLTASLDTGAAEIALQSVSQLASFNIKAQGNIASKPYNWTIDGDISNIDFEAMGLSDSTMGGNLAFGSRVVYNPGKIMNVNASLDLNHIDWRLPSGSINGNDLLLTFTSDDSLTTARATQGDLSLKFVAPESIDSMISGINKVSALLDSAIADHKTDIIAIQNAAPRFNLDLRGGNTNILTSYLISAGMDFSELCLTAANDTSINIEGSIIGFSSGTTVLDTLQVSVNQRGPVMELYGHMGNRMGNLDQWAQVNVNGELSGESAWIMLSQRDAHHKTGYHLGLKANMDGDKISVSVIPSNPVIGYKDWSVNDSNFISLDLADKHFDANLFLRNAESSIHLYTDHSEHNDSVQEDMNLKVSDVKIADWIVLNPYAPPVTGSISADMQFGWGNQSVNGSGCIGVDSLTYGREYVGSFDLDVQLMTNSKGTIRAATTLMVDSIKTITAVGNLNDSTASSPFLLDFKMIHFPLGVLNPFLPADIARLRGTLNGTMDITGSLSEPIFNGYLDFDSTVLRIPMLGTEFNFSDEKIPVDSNVARFADFTITGPNKNPLSINGTVDAHHISDILIDLKANAENMQVVSSKKGRGVGIYGKGFVNLDASVEGSLSRMNVEANLAVLPSTNVTYITGGATTQLSSKSTAGVVKFVNFADTAAVESADTITPPSMLIDLDASLTLIQGSTINVDLSPDGKNRLQLLSSGTLNYSLDYMGDSQITGRLNVNGGFVRYTPPFMSEKLFKFQEGSYISFNGNMMNPYINLKAVDVLRANVQQEGQNSRLINFDVILSVTNTLENMDVAFDLTTNDDITVANELQSMTPTQRANQAMNLLLYNVYTGPGTKASSSLNGNPLFSFLESQVNSWAANNIKGVDLSFVIDQYDSTTNGAQSTTTSYSYKISKSLFNDRFKISVGGNYSSDDDPDQNFSQNLINDISFEYFLTPTGNMYVKIFRHTGFESILEGEVTQTGVGFVYKRKLSRLIDLFKPLRYLRRKQNGSSQKITAQ